MSVSPAVCYHMSHNLLSSPEMHLLPARLPVQPVGDGEDSAALSRLLQGVQDSPLGLHVQIGGDLVQ